MWPMAVLQQALSLRQARPWCADPAKASNIYGLHISRMINLTLLAPDIIRAILDEWQPRHLNLQAMRGRGAGVSLDRENAPKRQANRMHSRLVNDASSGNRRS